MKIGLFTTMTNPEKRNDPWREALNCYSDISEYITIVGSDWPYEFKWDHIGKTFHEGFLKTKTDWVIRMDLDYFFHENDIPKLSNVFKQYDSFPAISFPQYQFFCPERYQIKTLICIALNKKNFPNIILNGGGDLCLPTLDSKVINPWTVPLVNIPVWQYDSIFRTKEIIAEDRARFARAWYRYFGEWGERGGPSPEEAYNAWIESIKIKYKKHIFRMKIDSHPVYIKDKLKNLNQDMFGYDMFGLKTSFKFNFLEFLKAQNLKNKIEYKSII